MLYLMADVAKTWPLDPTPSTMIEAMTTIKSVRRKRDTDRTTTKKVRVKISSVLIKLCTKTKLE